MLEFWGASDLFQHFKLLKIAIRISRLKKCIYLPTSAHPVGQPRELAAAGRLGAGGRIQAKVQGGDVEVDGAGLVELA